mmetsp:Transcript_33556/g.6088  ORF Transcript_33556/g.6088 Transcript_33556/m.6088 type:complete len:105 (+) Transcript_33556:696-1010(+)
MMIVSPFMMDLYKEIITIHKILYNRTTSKDLRTVFLKMIENRLHGDLKIGGKKSPVEIYSEVLFKEVNKKSLIYNGERKERLKRRSKRKGGQCLETIIHKEKLL